MNLDELLALSEEQLASEGIQLGPVPTPVPTPMGTTMPNTDVDLAGKFTSGFTEGLQSLGGLVDVGQALMTQPGREAIYKQVSELPPEAWAKGVTREALGTAGAGAALAVPVVGPLLAPGAYAVGRTAGDILLSALKYQEPKTPEQIAEQMATEAGGAYGGELLTRGLGKVLGKVPSTVQAIKRKTTEFMGPATPQAAKEEVGKILLEQGYNPEVARQIRTEAGKAVPSTAGGMTTAETFQAGGGSRQQVGQLASLEDVMTTQLPQEAPAYAAFKQSQEEARQSAIASLGKGEDLNPATTGTQVMNIIEQAQNESQKLVDQLYEAIPADITIDVRKGDLKGKIAKLKEKTYKPQTTKGGKIKETGTPPPADLQNLIDNFQQSEALLTPGQLQKYYSDFGAAARKYSGNANLDNRAAALATQIKGLIRNKLESVGGVSEPFIAANKAAFEHAKTYYEGPLKNLAAKDLQGDQVVKLITGSNPAVEQFFEMIGKDSPAHDLIKAQYVSDVMSTVTKDVTTINKLRQKRFINKALFGEDAQIFDDLINDAAVRAKTKRAGTAAGGSQTAARLQPQITRLFKRAELPKETEWTKLVTASSAAGLLGGMGMGLPGLALAAGPAAYNYLSQARKAAVSSELGKAIREALLNPRKFEETLKAGRRAKALEARQAVRARQTGETIKDVLTKAAPISRRVGAYGASGTETEPAMTEGEQLQQFFRGR